MYWEDKYNSQKSSVEDPVLGMEDKEVDTTETRKTRRGLFARGLFFLFLLCANVVVMLTVYDVCVAKKGTPFLTTVKSNYIYKQCTKHYIAQESYGKVSVIIRDDTEQMKTEK